MKRFIRIIGIGIPLGIVLIVIKNVMNIEDDVFWKQYMIVGALVIVGAVIINCIYQIKFVKKLNKITKLITEDDNIDLFFEKIEKLLTKCKSNYNRSLLLINLSYGYAKKEQYAKGLEVLESIEPKRVKGINKIIFYLNMSCFHFHLGNYEDVISITEKNSKEFSKFKNNPHLGWNIASNNIYFYIAKGEFEEAKKLIEEAKEKWNGKKEMQEEWEMLNQVLDTKNDNGRIMQ